MHAEMHQSAREVVDLERIEIVDRATDQNDIPLRAVGLDPAVSLFVREHLALHDAQVEIAGAGDILAELLIAFRSEQERRWLHGAGPMTTQTAFTG